MEVRARSKYVRSSPRKIRIVMNLVRGKNVNEALDILHFTPKKGARLLEKTIRSAVANFMHLDDSRKFETSDLVISKAFVDGGPIAKRFRPGPMGRASRIRKRFSHITVYISGEES
ncbi:50S ribosomal protein L22 [candidate division KSB1 bacterium]